MTLSLYAAVVPSFTQILNSIEGLLEKSEAYVAERGIAPENLIEAR
jgi:uncharacterized protein